MIKNKLYHGGYGNERKARIPSVQERAVTSIVIFLFRELRGRAFPSARLLRAIRADDVDPSIVAVVRDADSPRAAADFAVLDEAAVEIRFDVNLDFLSAIGARHEKTVFHTFR